MDSAALATGQRVLLVRDLGSGQHSVSSGIADTLLTHTLRTDIQCSVVVTYVYDKIEK